MWSCYRASVPSASGDRARQSARPDGDVGAYGFRLSGPLPPDRLRVRGVTHWPKLQVEVEPDPVAREGEHVVQRPEGAVCLSRDLRLVRLPGTPETPLSDLVHPVLAGAGSMAAHARGEVVVHAGAFVGPGGAWVVLGRREQGKSTLLAEQHLRGMPIMADDITVLRADRVCAGPRCIDLRPDAAHTLELGLDGPVRQGQRYRVELPPIDGEAPLAGFIELEWSPQVSLDPLRPAERVKRLLRASGRNPLRGPEVLLDLAVRPYLVLHRSPTKESSATALSLLHRELDRRASSSGDRP